jgi:hypothetical protein
VRRLGADETCQRRRKLVHRGAIVGPASDACRGWKTIWRTAPRAQCPRRRSGTAGPSR